MRDWYVLWYFRALRKSSSDIAVDALSTSALTHIMLDITYRDAKKRTLFDIPETRDEVLRTVLGAESIRQAIKRGKVQVVLF